jgi:formiminotetrahydrofolate cyclodeaminase
MLADMYLREFLDRTSSKEAVPGGGSVAALSSALASALTSMVANLTIDKEEYLDVNEEMISISNEMRVRKCEFIQLIDKDANSFSTVIEAYKLPKSSEKLKTIRHEAIQDSMKYAAKVPLGIAIDTSKIFGMIEIVARKGNQNAVTDALVAAMMARTAIKSALCNVRINLKTIEDDAFVNEVTEQVNELDKFADQKEKEILDIVKF